MCFTNFLRAFEFDTQSSGPVSGQYFVINENANWFRAWLHGSMAFYESSNGHKREREMLYKINITIK